MNRKDLPPHAQVAINRILAGQPKQPPIAKRHGEFDSGLEMRFAEHLETYKRTHAGCCFRYQHHPAPLIINGTQEYTPDFRVAWMPFPENKWLEVYIDTKGYAYEVDKFRLKTAAWQHQDKQIYVVHEQGRGWTYLRIMPGAETIQWKRGGKTTAPWEENHE